MARKRFGKQELTEAADEIVTTWQKRKSNRRVLEQEMREIDRQLEMVPKERTTSRKSVHGQREAEWFPDMELPLQSQTLEVLNADEIRMTLPDSGSWFEARVNASQEDFTSMEASLQSGRLLSGDNDPSSGITQDNLDKVAGAFVDHQHRQYDFADNLNLIYGEGNKYGMGIGRARTLTKRITQETAKGITRELQKIPVLVPRSLKKTYLDEDIHDIIAAGHQIGPNIIFENDQRVEDLKLAASKAPDSEGWLPAALKGMENGSNGSVKTLELEGDLIIDRKTTDSQVHQGVIISVAVAFAGTKEQPTMDRRVYRVQKRETPGSSYFLFPYHREGLGTPYATSPLRKGRPIQSAAVEALNRLLQVAILTAERPGVYDRDDPTLAAQGGPIIEPGRWNAVSGGTNAMAFMDVGDVAPLLALYQSLINQYYDVVGVNPPRLGERTVSHTTLGSKELELSRGTVRTVDFVRSSLNGPLTRWLDMSYRMGRKLVNGERSFYVERYNSFVTISGQSDLPEEVIWKAFGSGAPDEEQARQAQRLASLQLAIQVDQLRQASILQGAPSSLNFDNILRQTLMQGGWTDVDQLIASGVDALSEGATAGPPVPGASGGALSAAPAAIQALGSQLQ